MNTFTLRLFTGAATAVLSVGLCGAVFAQAASAPAADPAPRAARAGRGQHARGMFKQLNLTSDQKTQLKALRDSLKPRRDAVMNNAGLSETDRKEQLKALRNELRDKSLQVLTPEQREKLKAQRLEMKTKRGAK